MKKTNLIFLLFSTTTTIASILNASAQEINYEREYRKGISSYKSGDYSLAISELSPLTSRKYQNGLVPYAHYYYALSAQKTNRLNESRNMLLQLRERFPDWKKIDEVSYLLADLAFREKQFGVALDYLGEISNSNLKIDIENLKRFYITKLQDLTYLKSLNRQYPSDKILALSLIELIQKTSNSKPDLELSDELTNRFGVAKKSASNPSLPAVIRKNNNFQKGYYNVAVALPFKLKGFSANQRIRSNQFAFDMYDGMKLAKAKLQQEGVLVNLFPYDVGSDQEEMLDVINNTNFAQTDLIIGPVYNETAQLAADYAETNGIYFIHPTTLSTEIVAKHPNTLLLHPSFSRQAEKGFDFMRSSSSNTTKKVAIYYGSARRDSTLATEYQTKAIKEGFQVVDFRKTREKLDSTATIFSSNNIGHITVFSSVESDGNKVISMLNKRKINVPILAFPSCFNLTNAPSSSFEGRDIYFLDTEFLDTSKQQLRDFQSQYINKRNTIPSIHTLQGYDMVLFLGRMLHKYRDKLRNGLDVSSYDEDYLLSGFSYQSSNDNQEVPIIQMQDMRWTRVNKN